jgi:hypothetical protein
MFACWLVVIYFNKFQYIIMGDMQEYEDTYVTVTYISWVGAVVVILCCGSGIVCMRRNSSRAENLRADLELPTVPPSEFSITL